MSFTTTQITHTYSNADGTNASGSLTFTLLKQMTNGATTIIPADLTANLNASGVLSQAITSNADAGTVPTDASWRVDQRILGAEQQSWFIVVPPQLSETNGSTTINTKTVQLSSVTAAANMVGQSITGTGIPSSTTITAVNTTLNQVTISANATASGTGLSLVIGATIDLGTLLPGAQQVG